MEGLLTNLMFEVPTDYKIERVVINKKYVEGKGKPELSKSTKAEQTASSCKGRSGRRQVTA